MATETLKRSAFAVADPVVLLAHGRNEKKYRIRLEDAAVDIGRRAMIKFCCQLIFQSVGYILYKNQRDNSNGIYL